TTATPANGDLLELAASRSTVPGTQVPLYLTITDGGGYQFRDTLSVIVGAPQVAFSDDAGHGMGNWTASGGWGIEYVGGDPEFSDSPDDLYTTTALAILTKTAPVDLSGAQHAYLSFNTSYDIEGGADAGRVEVSTDGGATWTGLRGR